ncbi:MAG: gliding motility-associated C-terminal domain-containing protein, partial [Reichenbachiella sp.]
AAVDESGTPSVTDYTFTWYRGTDTSDATSLITTTADDNTNQGSAIISGVSGIQNLSADTYTVVVVDTSDPNNTCETEASFTILDELPIISISTSEYTLTDNANCTNTGSFAITDVLEDGVATGNLAGYSFTFTYEDGAAITVGNTTGTNGSTLENIEGGDYKVVIQNTTTTCSSSEFYFTIEDTHENPVIILDSSSPDTNCTSPENEGDGTLTINLNGATITDFEIVWFRGSDVSDATMNLATGSNIGSASINTDGSALTALSPDTYTAVVTDNNIADGNFTCSTQSSFEITNLPGTFSIDSAAVAATINHITDCGGSNGSITISDANIDGVLTDYTFIWYSASPLTDLGVANNTTSLTNVEAGFYYVEATNSTGCNTGLSLFEIEDQTEAPVVTASNTVVDTSCDTDTNEGNGEIEWSITNDDAGSYTFQWYTGATVDEGIAITDNGTITGATGTAISGTVSGLSAGIYSIRVIDSANPSNTCEGDFTIEIIGDETSFSIETVSSVNNTNCVNPNGEIEVTSVLENSVSVDLTNYTVTILTSDGDPHSGNDVANGHVDQLPAGNYVINITNAFECMSDIFDVTILDNSTPPSIVFTVDQADQYCTGGNAQLTVTTDAASPTYLWSTGETTATANNLDAIEYTVTITDGVTGCTVTDSFTVPFEEENIMIEVENEVTVTPTTLCGALVNGSIQIDAISPYTVADYTYILHTGTYTAGAGTDMGANNGLFENLGADTYYIEAFNTITSCTSGVFEIIVEDESIAPIVDMVAFELQSNCDVTNPNGLFTVGVNESGIINSSTTDYTFDWSANGGPANDPTYTNVAQGFYDITVTNTATSCVTTETYGMIDAPNNPLLINVTTAGNENCMDANGELVIQVLNNVNDSPIFEYYLYEGDVPSAGGDAANLLNSNFSQDLEDGTYTVLVIDDDSKCASEPTAVEIDNLMNTDDMMMSINQDHALTKCDLTRADGQATVMSIPEDPSRYTFYWYEGETTSGALVDSTLTVFQLIDQTYTINMLDRYTGCETTDQITITNETVPVPLPLTELISDNINCVTPNGAVSADVNGTIEGYTFVWKNNDNLIDTLSSTFTAPGLDEGIYNVKATDINTGCVSEASEIAVIRDRVIPTFTVEITESACNELISEFSGEYVGNGTADLVFDNNTFVDEFFWTVDEGVAIDTANYEATFSKDERLSGISPGDYRVLIVDDNECVHEEAFVITTESVIFNAVSDNGDNKNDYFRITCADRFENNSVKIYNRSGTLVYETRNYEDNTNGNVFKGTGNTGIGGGGSLPEGTYFYIFDKGAGSSDDVVQGYLELIR